MEICKKIWGIISTIVTAKDIHDNIHSTEHVKVDEMLNETGKHVIGWEVEVLYDPIPFDVTINDKEFTIDTLGFNYINHIPNEFIENRSFLYHLVGEQITAFNVPYFEIEDIEKL